MLYVLNPDLIEINLLLCMSMEGWTLGFLFSLGNTEIEPQNILWSGG